jgi:hypothetical protein
MMLRLLFTVFVSLPLFSASVMAESKPQPRRELLSCEPTAADLDRAKALLLNWEKERPTDAPRRVMQVVYWNPADREPQPAYQTRLTKVMLHIQEFYRREMAAWGFPNRTIQLDLDAKQQLKIHVAKGKLKSEECSESDRSDGQEIKKDSYEALKAAGIDGSQETVVIFCNLSDWDEKERRMSHHSPYYAGGNSKGGTAWQVDSPLLDSDFISVQDQHLTDGQYGRISLGKYNSIFVGGVCHELGHALGLPHAKESVEARKLRGSALMGSGNRTYGEDLRGESKGSFLALGHALKLASHPQFSGSTRELATKVDFDFSELKLEPQLTGLKVTGKVTGSLPVYTVLAYADPDGNGDYDSELAAGIPLADGTFQILVPNHEKKNRTARLSFVAVAVNGAASAGVWSSESLTFPYRVTGNGGYEVQAAHEILALQQLQSSTATPDQLAAAPAVVREALQRLEKPNHANDKPKPSAVAADVKTTPLTDTKPDSAKTGYMGVHFDRTPDKKPLVGANGVYPHGLYAHAEATHVYHLGGQWKSFQGDCLVLQEGRGLVQGTIYADDKPIWKSLDVKVGEVKPFTVDVTGVQVLKLQITAPDRTGAWGAWGKPTLSR